MLAGLLFLLQPVVGPPVEALFDLDIILFFLFGEAAGDPVVGASVGGAVGASVGEAVGASVGEAVGASVGMQLAVDRMFRIQCSQPRVARPGSFVA